MAKLDVSDLAHLSTLQVASSVKLETVDLSHNAELTTLSLPNATTASGLEAAGLAEHWYLTDIDSALPLGDESYSVEWDLRPDASTASMSMAPLTYWNTMTQGA